MRVVIDVTSCVKTRLGGIGVYGAELVRGCLRVAPENEYVLAVRPNRWTRRSLIADLCPQLERRLLFDRGHRFTLGSHVDVLHGVGVRLPASGQFPKVVMLHDINVFEFPELSKPDWRVKRQRRIRQTIDRADLIICYSAQGRDALGQHLGVSPERVRVVPLGIDIERFRRPPDHELAAVLERHDLTQRPYVLSVGQYGTRKNQQGLVEAFAAAELPDEWLLVLGGPRHEAIEELRASAKRLGIAPERLRTPGWVLDDELPALIAGAGFYVCASLHEGFGLPVIEAQACGTPVAASNRAALVETLGDCGVAFDPADLDDFAGALAKLAGDPSLRAELSAAGPPRVAANYTWDHLAQATLAVWKEAQNG
ncbi:MAG: glycosyltransferase involved in cell wall biosynthesis [Pseudohongiellaceae bacterium]|jgi:glycosyltransferase involved in cell wall biosynthesis